MSGRTNIVSLLLELAVFIALEVASLLMLSHNGTMQGLWLNRGFHAINAGLWGGGENIAGYFSLRRQNDELAAENFRLQQELRELEHQKDVAEHESVEQIGNFEYIHASVVKHSTNKQHNYMIVGKGAADGVQKGAGVITSQGVIGIVEAVSRHYSYVMAFTNKDMAVSARIGRSGVIGPLSWDGISTRRALLGEIPHHSPVARGDTIYTSGYSSIFPPDVPLGLAGSSKLVGGASLEIKVWLFEDLATVRYVTIVNNLERDEITQLEEEQQQ